MPSPPEAGFTPAGMMRRRPRIDRTALRPLGRERRRPPSRVARPRAGLREGCRVMEKGGEAPSESVSQDGHRRQPGARALLPIREEEVAPASGAQPRVPDGLGPEPGADELV